MDVIIVEDTGDIQTTPLMWECECDNVQDYLHMKNEQRCPRCGAHQEDCPDARIEDIRELLDRQTAILLRGDE